LGLGIFMGAWICMLGILAGALAAWAWKAGQP
jgi:hypothetical protein